MLEQSKITQIDQARLVAGSGRAAADRGTSTVLLDTPTADDPNRAVHEVRQYPEHLTNIHSDLSIGHTSSPHRCDPSALEEQPVTVAP